MSHPSHWFITGTSSGFGWHMTERLLARGDRVAAMVRTPQTMAPLRERYGERLWVAGADLTDAEAVQAAVEQAFAALGRIDVVVNNAGYGLFGAAEEVTETQIRHQLDTNVLGSMRVIRAALPYLRAQGHGRILQVSSEGGQVAYPCFSIYHASKWAIEGFVESLAQEVASFGISVTIAEPGASGTSFSASKIEPPQSMPVYEDTPVGEVRRMLASGNLKDFGVLGDPVKIAQAMIDVAAAEPAPRRRVMNSSSYRHVHDALSRRLRELEAQREIAFATDAD